MRFFSQHRTLNNIFLLRNAALVCVCSVSSSELFKIEQFTNMAMCMLTFFASGVMAEQPGSGCVCVCVHENGDENR